MKTEQPGVEDGGTGHESVLKPASNRDFRLIDDGIQELSDDDVDSLPPPETEPESNRKRKKVEDKGPFLHRYIFNGLIPLNNLH